MDMTTSTTTSGPGSSPARTAPPAHTPLAAPTPLAGPGQPVDWLFIYKFNDSSFPGCGDGQAPVPGTPGIFGGVVKDYPEGQSQQYVFATSEAPTLVKGAGCVGATLTDPLGATFAQVYNTPGYHYLLWNDQFYGNPIASLGGPMGHAKGMLAWNDDGDGFVLQVSTPSWPASGSANVSRNRAKTIGALQTTVQAGVTTASGKNPAAEFDYNTLGCCNDDDVEVAQHFFCLSINHGDLVLILQALDNASVVTSPTEPALCNNGGPADVQQLVNRLGRKSSNTECTHVTLSSGVQLISKPSALAVPPWQLVSATLGGIDLRVVSWWAEPKIYSTRAGDVPGCWNPSLGVPGEIEIATSGQWESTPFALLGGNGRNSNHAKVGLSKSPAARYSIFGDENQQGALRVGYDTTGPYAPKTPPAITEVQPCTSSQNGRGGTFYVVDNEELLASLSSLFAGRSAGTDAASTDLTNLAG